MGLVLAVLVLAGCTGQQEEPAPEPSNGPDGQVTTPAGDGQGPGGPDGSGTEGESQEPEEDYPAPERPAAMENNDIDGAEAAGVYFLELFYYALATGDLQIWEEMSGETCGFCATTHENITEVYEAGGYFETSPPEFLTSTAHIATDDRGDYYFQGQAHIAPVREYDNSNSLARDDPPVDLNIRAVLSETESGWLIGAVEAEDVTDAES